MRVLTHTYEHKLGTKIQKRSDTLHMKGLKTDSMRLKFNLQETKRGVTRACHTSILGISLDENARA